MQGKSELLTKQLGEDPGRRGAGGFGSVQQSLDSPSPAFCARISAGC